MAAETTTAALAEMSIWGLVQGASPLVQGVMLVLLLASLASWYVIVRRGLALRRDERIYRTLRGQFQSEGGLEQLARQARPHSTAHGGLLRVADAGLREFRALAGAPGQNSAAVLEGVERALQAAIAEQEEALEQGLPLLASIGSVSPYIGLFGTVWGIMTAFIGLSQVQQATLAAVAPGIAEALIATAIGLFAAIPAVIAYNRYAARAQTLAAGYYRFGNELLQHLHRRLLQAGAARSGAHEGATAGSASHAA